MSTSTQQKAPQDILTWLPIPLATGTWIRDADGNLVEIAGIAVTVTRRDGVTVPVPVNHTAGGWRTN